MVKSLPVKRLVTYIPRGGETEGRMPLRGDALKKTLLRPCELDTMAMVFVWE